MSSRDKIERWLLADWNGGRLLKSSSMIRVTEEVNVGISETSHRASTPRLDTVSDGGKVPTEVPMSLQAIENTSVAQRSELKAEGRDYSPSGSSWEPSDEEISSDSDSVLFPESEKVNYTKQYLNKSSLKKGPKPAHRPKDVTNILKARQTNGTSSNRKRAHKHSVRPISVKKYSADSTKRNHTPTIDLPKMNMDINAQEIKDIKAGFRELFRMLNELKPQPIKYFKELSPPVTKTSNTNIGSEDYEDNSDRSESEDSDRSNDNVLISNKFSRIAPRVLKQEYNARNDDWVRIGTGNTMIHRDKFRKVKWKSYTIATRTLLLAAFPRRILATHSLTGKRSPAFRNKPAKMCLDPKIVADIILEITTRFNVKENLVRSIITTKCADECKMFKSRLKSKNKLNDENAQPDIKEDLKNII